MLAAARCRWPLARLTSAGRACSARVHTCRQVCSAGPGLRTLTFLSTDPQATSGLAELLASVARPGDVLLLRGNVGMGKSHFRSDRPPGLAVLAVPFKAGMRLGMDSGARPSLAVLTALSAPRRPPPCSRAFIRGAMGDADLLVPSPTYLLQQTYDSPAGRCWFHRNPLPPPLWPMACVAPSRKR